MNWNNILETFLPLFFLAIVTFIGTVLYRNRNKIFNYYKRLYLLIFPVNFNIGLSLDFNEGLNSGNYFDQIKKNLNLLIEDSNLKKNIIVKDLSEIQRFKDEAQAETFRRKTDIDLIIWGGFTNDNLKIDGKIINKINLKFTFGHPTDEKNIIGKMIKFDIGSKFAIKNYWQIFEDNSHNDIAVVSTNLFHLSTYIIALSLKLYGKIEKSLELYEKLYAQLVNSKDDFSSSIIPHLINCYDILSVKYGVDKNDYPSAIKYARKIISLDSHNFNAISNLAIFNYKHGNKLESDKFIKLLIKYYPRSPITLVDVAFIKILEKNYKNAFKNYEKLIAYKEINFSPLQVVDFLNTEYSKVKEPAFLYGSGIISYYYGDRKMGKQDLKMFLKKAKSYDYKSMRYNANKLIN